MDEQQPTLKRRSDAPDDGGGLGAGPSKIPRLRDSLTPESAGMVENDNSSEKEKYRHLLASRDKKITAKRTRRRGGNGNATSKSDDGHSQSRDDRASSAGGNVSDADGSEYEVAEIEQKYVERNGRVLYKVRWANGQATKEPIENLDGCLELIEAYEHRLKDDAGTEPSLKKWYLSDQRHALGYSRSQDQQQDQQSSAFNAGDSDDDEGGYEEGTSGEDEDDEELSGEGELDDGASGRNDDDGDSPPAVERKGGLDTSTNLLSAQGSLQPGSSRAKSEQPSEAGGSKTALRKPPQIDKLARTKKTSDTASISSTKTSTKGKEKASAAPAVKIPSHHLVCEKCGMGNKGRKSRDVEEDGPLLNCLQCCNTYHQNCVGGRKSRDRKPKYTQENFVCQMCQAEQAEQPLQCLYCRQGFENEVAFRCDRCAGVGHDNCLVVEFDEAFDIMYDEELDCEEGTVNWFHRRWKCIDCIRWSDEVAQILTYRDITEGESKSREYLIKYRNHSHKHNDWVTERWLSSLITGKQKYKTFWKKVEEDNEKAQKWGLQQLPWPKSENEAVPPEWKRVDRILDIKVSKEEVKSKKKGGVKTEPTVKIEQALVKFQDQPWNESYWEKFPEEGEPDFEEFDAAFKAFKLRETLSTVKPQQKGRRRFEELSAQPDTIKGGDLKDYQLDGLNWLLYNHFENRSCILADEMGLGKTIQTIAFLDYLMEKQGLTPFLIVVPQSTLLNWVREFQMWAPQMEVLTFYGERAARDIIKDYALFQNTKPGKERLLKCHVLLTTPDTLQLETRVFQEVNWEVLIVDEGHQRVKNAESLQFEALASLTVKHKVLLTGTPVQNNLLEMFNLLHFLDKETFPDPQKMSDEYGAGLNKDKLADLHALVRPYILRRIKSDVMQALPAKSETIVPVGLSLLQRSLYKQILLDNYEVLASGALKKKTASARSQLISKVLADIRRLLQHPYLLKDVEPKFSSREETHRRLIESSGKLYLLDKMLKKLMANGHRVLIFSTMKLVLDIVEDYLLGEGLKYCRLDGETSLKERQERIDTFNAPGSDIPVFILTTRAGGLGINLTSADSVIIWDSDWNPHQDLQALARAHRIGQKNHVGVWKFVTKGTAEERIFQIAKKKLILDHLVVQTLEQENLDDKDVEGVLRFGAEQLFNADDNDNANEMSLTYDDAALDKLLERVEEEKPKENEKKSSSFSFAKIWQTSQMEHHADDMEIDEALAADGGDADTEMQADDQGEAFWERLLSGRVKRGEEKGIKGPRNRNQVDYATPSKRNRRSRMADFAGADVEGSDGGSVQSWEGSDDEEEGSGESEDDERSAGGTVEDENDYTDDELDIFNDSLYCFLCGQHCGAGATNSPICCPISLDIPAMEAQIAKLPTGVESKVLSGIYQLRKDCLIRQIETARLHYFAIRLGHDGLDSATDFTLVDSPPDTTTPDEGPMDETPDTAATGKATGTADKPAEKVTENAAADPGTPLEEDVILVED